ncbi:hypothetical protein vBKpnSKpLi5_24 [Klebsiella phage vB_KpnS_KpLi5]|nr:hypothetical protein vBKpnSKpLi5_24 [Klebsiella phage vB_KpnS_KpLi5]
MLFIINFAFFTLLCVKYIKYDKKHKGKLLLKGDWNVAY